MVRKVSMLLRVVLVRWSSPSLFYKTQEPQSLEMMEQTQDEHARVAHPLRDSLDAWQPLCTAVGCSLLHLPHYSLLFSAFILLLLPLVISAYVLTILLGFHVRQPENRFHWDTELFWRRQLEQEVVISHPIGYMGAVIARCPLCLETNVRALWIAFFDMKILAKKHQVASSIIEFWWDFVLRHGLLMASVLKAGTRRLSQTG